MSRPPQPAPPQPEPARPTASDCEAVVGERCGSPGVVRMRAVWRCADCGFTTDCCGW